MFLVEKGRNNGNVRSMRICKYCILGEVEDEFCLYLSVLFINDYVYCIKENITGLVLQ